MLLAASEGQGFRYEVVACNDGYLVRPRDLDSGHLSQSDTMLFRTAAVAFRYAELSAACDRCAAARVSGQSGDAEFAEVAAQKTLFAEISSRLFDEGQEAIMVQAWEKADEEVTRRRYH